MTYPTMYAIESENKDAKFFNCVQVCYLLYRETSSICVNFLHVLLMLFGKLGNDMDLLVCWLQRGHQNSIEAMPMFFMLMIVGGIRHPLICSSLGAVYIVSRYFYFTGYSTGDPQNRLKIGLVSLLFRIISCFWITYFHLGWI